MAGQGYEAMVLCEALRADEYGCDVKMLRNQADEIVGVEASGDVVKLVPLRRAVGEVHSRL